MMLRRRRCGGGSKNSFTLVENNDSGEVFDPSITTSIDTTLVWVSSDGYSTTTTGTTHDLSYTAPANGPRKWTITCVAGLGAISRIDMNTDKLERIDISLLRSLLDARAYHNASLVMSLRDLPRGLTYFMSYECPFIVGDLGDLPKPNTHVHVGECTQITGDLSDLPRSLYVCYLYDNKKITGNLSDLAPTINDLHLGYIDNIYGSLSHITSNMLYAFLQGNSHIVACSVSHLVSIRDLRIYGMQWSSASVDTVLLSISDAIHANPGHFTYATPHLEIGGSNDPPGGNASAAITDPLDTPGSGESDSDWQWDDVAGKHKALTGMAAIWVMRNNPDHAWTVTATEVT